MKHFVWGSIAFPPTYNIQVANSSENFLLLHSSVKNLIGTQIQTKTLIEILYFRNSSKLGNQRNDSTWTAGNREI